MYCSVMMGGIFSFISMPDLNNYFKEIYYYYNVYVIKTIVELASKSAWLTGKGHESKGKPKVCGSRLPR